MYQQQLLQAQAQQQAQAKQKEAQKLVPPSRPRLSHPGEKVQIPEKIMLSEAEDDNLASQNLNDKEIAELQKQLSSLQRNQKYKVTAQNDEEDDEEDEEEDSD